MNKLYLPEFIYFKLKHGRDDYYMEQDCKQYLYDYIAGSCGYEAFEIFEDEEEVYVCDIPVRVAKVLEEESKETGTSIEHLAAFIINSAVEH